ncbi:zinc finger protein 768-like isoform X2 [Actinia tenebrosa]|nr:zinc finger protein 768-like isoform X2 [Actinia tenebrosa]XP_031561230.1 zinc finger protein 768-like isoform X2 [Actinia tenebrosa]
MFHVGSSGHESDEDDEPDLFQCGKCRQMFTNLQKYLRHKSSRECRQKSASTPSTVTSPGFSEPGTLEGYEENSVSQSPPKRKHDRKGIARRVSNVPEADSDPPSPETPVILRDPPRPFAVGQPIAMGMSPVCTVINGLPSPVSRSGISAFQPPIPTLKSPTERSPIYSRPEISHQGPTLTSRQGYSLAYTQPQQTPMQHVIINNPVHPGHILAGHGWPRATIAVDPHFSNSKEPIGSPHAPPQVRPDGKRAATSESHVQTPGMTAKSTAPPIVVHLKERGRPIRPKETGLTEEELTEELITPSGQKVFKCKKCEKEFSFSSRLKRHLLVHTGARPFECPICLRRFTQAVDLKRHMLRHSGQKPHVCHYCGKQYTRGDRLKVHLLSHSEASNHSMSSQPYNCSRCNQSFEEAEHLHLHTCGKLEDDPDNPAINDLDKAAHEEEDISNQGSFNQEDSMSGSEDRGEHKPKIYRCEICHSTFTKSTSLKAHLMKHTGERKYRCEHCSKTFFSSSSLKIHVRVHTGDRPFKCKDCPRKFSDPSNFNKHKRWHAKQRAHAGYGEYSMHAISIPTSNAVVDESSETKRRRMSDNDSIGTSSLKERHDSGASSYEVEGGQTPEGSDTLFVDDEDEEISVDDDEVQVGFTSPKVLVGMEDNVSDNEHTAMEKEEEKEQQQQLPEETKEEEEKDEKVEEK